MQKIDSKYCLEEHIFLKSVCYTEPHMLISPVKFLQYSTQYITITCVHIANMIIQTLGIKYNIILKLK